MNNIKKKVTVGVLAATIAATSVAIPSLMLADDSEFEEIDITIASEPNDLLPTSIEEDKTEAYSFVEQLSEVMNSDGPFSEEHGKILKWNSSFSYNIPWIIKDFPITGFEELPVEYVYYDYISDGKATPIYCLDYNAKSPTHLDGIGSYQLTLYKNEFKKYKTKEMNNIDFKNSTLMLAPLMYGYPADNYGLTTGEDRWATSIAFKFISGSLYDENYNVANNGLTYEDFINDSFLNGFRSILGMYDSSCASLDETTWNAYLEYVNDYINSSNGFNAGSDAGSSIVYNPSYITDYTPDTTNAGEVMGAVYLMLAGASDIRQDNGNYERTVSLTKPTNSEIIAATVSGSHISGVGPYSVHLNQGTMYSSKNAVEKPDDSYLTDFLLKDNVIVSIEGAPTGVYIGDENGNELSKADSSYVVASDTNFYVWDSNPPSSTGIDYKIQIESENLENVANAYYQCSDPKTQRMVLYVATPVKGEFNVNFTGKTGELKIKKVDGSDNTTPLSNVSFDVYDNVGCTGTALATITTDAKGEASCTLDYGTYYLKEKAAPDHYIGISDPIEVTVSAATVAAGTANTITNTPLGSLTITKQDSVTATALSGVKFTLASASNITYNGASVTAGNAIGGEKTTDTNGQIVWDNLPYGTYTLTETAAPSGYVIDTKTQTITIAGTSNSTRYVSKTVTNTPLGSLTITKQDSVTKGALSGAKFTLTSILDISYNGATVTAGTAIGGEKTTDTNGTISWNNLPIGKYALTETSAPEGYAIDTKSQEITIAGTSDNVKHVTKTITNSPLGSLTITKQDNVTKGALSGAKFTLTSSSDISYNGATVTAGTAIGGEKTTDTNGKISWSNLPIGKYTLTETSAPDGYVIDTKSQEITIAGTSDDVKHVTKTIPNSPLGSLTITKKDSSTNETLSGAKFKLTSESAINYNGATVAAGEAIGGEKTTDNEGHISWNNLPCGTYTLTETEAPAGYEIVTKTQTITIAGTNDASKYVTRAITNAPRGGLVIIKYDKDSKAKLSGAVFTVTTKSAITYKGTNYAANTVVATVTSNDIGSAAVSDLPQGEYVVKEISAPENYVPSGKEYTVKISEQDGETLNYTLEVPNTLKTGKFKINKTNPTGDVPIVAGFTLYTTKETYYNGNVYRPDRAILSFSTDKNGQYESPEIPIGDYYLKETSTEEKYLLPEGTVANITIEPDATSIQTINIKNYEKDNYFSIYKKDANTGSYLSGATFEIYNDNDELVDTITTNKNGVATSSDLLYGEYTIKETIAPDGYYLNSETYTVTVGDNPNEISITVEDKPELGKIEIIKVDALDESKKLENVSFEIYDSDKKLVDKVNTDHNGRALTKEIPCGTYYIKEVTTPDGYIINSDEIQVEIETSSTQEFVIKTVTVKNTPIRGKIEIIKVDALDNSKKIENVSFEIYDINKNLVEKVNTDHDGRAITKEIPCGTYYIKEVSAPEGYIINNDEIEVVIKSTGTQSLITKTVTVENTPVKGQIEIIKVDAIDNSKRIENVSFDIYDSDNNLVEKVNTDHSGRALSKELDCGTYYIKEVAAPNGYIMNSDEIEVSIVPNGKGSLIIETIMVGNTPIMGKIQIHKTDKDTNAPLEGILFDVYDSEGNLIEILTTDKSGYAITNSLRVGEYTVKERQTLEGYTLLTAPYVVNIEDDSTITLDITNEKPEIPVYKGQLQIVKKDSKTKKAIAKVDFELYAKEEIIESGELIYKKDQLIKKLTTDKLGIAESGLLPLGTYYVKETSIIDGYLENDKEYTFTLNSSNYNKVQSQTVYNTPTEVVITKVDLTDASPLPGAKIEIYDEDKELVFEDVTDSNGEIEAFGLPVGKYTFKETAAPDGYTRNSETFKFEITESGKVKGDTTITDTPTEVIITKKDLTTGAPLAGATIEIKDSKGKTVFKDVSDLNGEVKAMKLTPGKYTFTETAAPDGYTRNPETFEFELYEDGTVRGDCTITDTPTEVIITKKDLTTGAPLAGSTIEIKDSNGNTVFNEVSDPNGEVRAMKLKPGKYTFTETAAPDGYTRNPETFEFELYEDGTVKGDCTITDTPTEVVITKKDLTDAKPLPGATIQIIDSNGKLAFEGVTDKNGEIRAFKLVPGKYTFKEISAPDGYQLNTESFTFELFEDGRVVGDHEIYDERIPNIKTGVETDNTNKGIPVIIFVIGALAVVASIITFRRIRSHNHN